MTVTADFTSMMRCEWMLLHPPFILRLLFRGRMTWWICSHAAVAQSVARSQHRVGLSAATVSTWELSSAPYGPLTWWPPPECTVCLTAGRVTFIWRILWPDAHSGLITAIEGMWLPCMLMWECVENLFWLLSWTVKTVSMIRSWVLMFHPSFILWCNKPNIQDCGEKTDPHRMTLSPIWEPEPCPSCYVAMVLTTVMLIY